jgi:hypothetical protein
MNFKDFKSEADAVSAIHIIVAARKSGLTNKEISQIPFLMNLFSDSFLERIKSDFSRLAEIKIKNIARDFRLFNKCSLEKELWFAKDYFNGLHRGNKI